MSVLRARPWTSHEDIVLQRLAAAGKYLAAIAAEMTRSDWWTVKRNGIPVRHFPGKENAERFATDPEYRASPVTVKAREKAKGK